MWNEQLSKEEYDRRLKELDLKDYKTILELKKKAIEIRKDILKMLMLAGSGHTGGSLSLVKSGAGSLTISGASNNYGGGTTLAGGILTVPLLVLKVLPEAFVQLAAWPKTNKPPSINVLPAVSVNDPWSLTFNVPSVWPAVA